MKEGFDREIDSLLRRRARGTAELRSWGDGAGDGTPGAHLDADELGAFAEGALPSAARLAAVSHLADCERCRGVVVGLARVVGAGAEVKQQVVAATVPSESARPSAWRAFVASLFAPRVMRLAVPILALSLVGAVSYVALRSDKGGALQMAREGRSRPNVAMNQPAAPAAAPASDTNTNSAGVVEQIENAAPRAAQGTNGSSAQPKGHGDADGRPAETDPAREDAPTAAAEAPPPPPATAPAEGPAAVMGKAAPKTSATEEGESARTDNKEKSENRDRDKARASEPADDATSNDAAVQRRGQQSRVNEAQMPDGSRNQKRGADNNASGGYGNLAGAAPPRESDSDRPGSRSEAAGRARQPRQAEQKDDERAAQTRNAGGHRFRRDGDAWVDVNYKSSMPSTGVRRGTEGFRALVAKVPEIGRVAEAISGEVIVVVSGHAYSIR